MQAVQNFLSQFGAFSNLAADPRFQALIVVVLSFVVAKIADWVISRLITRWAQKTTTDLDDRIVDRGQLTSTDGDQAIAFPQWGQLKLLS